MKIDKMKGKLWFCMPVFVSAFLDTMITLIGQPPEYWNNSYKVVSEFNPLGKWLLTIHPLAFVAYCAIEVLLFSLLIILSPSMVSKFLLVFCTLCYTTAFYSWISGPFELGFFVSYLSISAPAILLVIALEKGSPYT